MATKILSAAVIGLECEIIEVEADIVPNRPQIHIVGLPDAAVQEAKQRVRSAVKNSAVDWPRGQININLAPADIKKQGPAYDLPIALALLLADKKITGSPLFDDSLFIGELSLDGHLRPVNGIISIALMMRKKGINKIFLPVENAAEAALIQNLEVYPIKSLSELLTYLEGKTELIAHKQKKDFWSAENLGNKYDMAYIKGQEHVKRALEIAAAGAHNILMQGPPGSGKTLLARTMPTILPEMVLEEALEVTKIYSVAGLLPNDQPLITNRPFRAPHHTASGVALVGGGTWPRPGEISLAHHGVLFLDEFPEFPRAVLENLRQPLEDGIINISRASGTLQFPAKFILLASMNPCPCGYYNDPDRQCTCSPAQIINYQNKISGPLLDRIDIHIEVPRVKVEKLTEQKEGENSEQIRQRVNRARQRQNRRFAKEKIFTNSQMSSHQVKNICTLVPAAQELLKNAVNQLHLSARAYYRILKLARTIADLAESEQIKTEHIAEALQYRPKVE